MDIHTAPMIGNVDHLVERSARVGILINIAAPALVAAVAFALHESGLVPVREGLSPSIGLLFYILGATALLELAAAFFVRRSLFSSQRAASFRDDEQQVERWVVRSSSIVFALGASPMIYGAVVYLLSGDVSQMAFFGLITLLAYRLLRPTTGLIEHALNPTESV